ncbi:MAG: PEP-CTERM sorting domain-containing protein [Phycisphaerales bacterium]|nr:PEP-CTERM sorting domain-containing protein [Phycisphaerales bacterium]
MNNRFGVCAAVVFACSGSALAQYGSINSLAEAPYWFADYFGESNLTITNNGLAGVRVEDRNFINSGFANRHHFALAVGGVPYRFQTNQSFKFECDVVITGPGRTEAGIWHGTAPFFPNSANADTGQFMVRPPATQTGAEIAAFGGRMPFFSSNQPENAGMPAAARDTTFHLTFIYNADVSPRTYQYGVNGVFTPLKIEGIDTAGFLPDSLLGVFVQGPNWFGPTDEHPRGDVDVQFTNLSIMIPAPASLALLGLGGLTALRRRR